MNAKHGDDGKDVVLAGGVALHYHPGTRFVELYWPRQNAPARTQRIALDERVQDVSVHPVHSGLDVLAVRIMPEGSGAASTVEFGVYHNIQQVGKPPASGYRIR